VGAIAPMQLASYDNSMPDVSHISEDYVSNKYAHYNNNDRLTAFDPGQPG